MPETAGEILGITAAKTELPGRLRKLQSGEINKVLLLRQNNPVAVILTVKEYDRMRAQEAHRELTKDLEDLIQALNSDDGTRTSLDDLKKKLKID